MSFEQLQPATQQQANVYLPYIQGSKRNFLPYAISLYDKGVLEGQRKIEGSENIPFAATWNIATLPSDLTRCRVQFEGNAELSYEVTIASFEFINFLIEMMENYKRYRLTDFSQTFYRKLLRIDE
ncbi:type IV pilus biogenesis protein EbsA [Fischerella sp. PCC 9605]|uniref:type IV pilus biogenesis protein EbsA n=1 Tax=Fischerella sp. PCC 9605 TaxID=1173024 RepID=UPI000478F51F|nr:type IV pilus biogenesis protein EbsA [Fischerella sp. PCC 9605]